MKENRTQGEYWYDPHVHTSEGSACATDSGAQMARAYAAHGYTGIVITDHFFYGNTAVDRTLPWEAWVERFCLGYEHAKAEGGKWGLQVFFGWEAAYDGTDFLIYGLDKAWLLAHPEIRDATVQEQWKLVHADGGMICHAHPYREAFYIHEIRLFPEYVDAVETVNAAHTGRDVGDLKSGHPEYNDKAAAYARRYRLPVMGGSDQHDTDMLNGGMAFPRKLKDVHDFISAVGTGEAKLLPGRP